LRGGDSVSAPPPWQPPPTGYAGPPPHKGEGALTSRSFARADIRENCGGHGFESPENFEGRESQHAIALRLEESRPAIIVANGLVERMASAIDFDHQPSPMRRKVCVVGTKGDLAPKVKYIERFTPKQIPQARLRRRHPPPQ